MHLALHTAAVDDDHSLARVEQFNLVAIHFQARRCRGHQLERCQLLAGSFVHELINEEVYSNVEGIEIGLVVVRYDERCAGHLHVGRVETLAVVQVLIELAHPCLLIVGIDAILGLRRVEGVSQTIRSGAPSVAAPAHAVELQVAHLAVVLEVAEVVGVFVVLDISDGYTVALRGFGLRHGAGKRGEHRAVGHDHDVIVTRVS